MNILNDILLIAGALFVIAMVLICLGLFMNPKKKQTDELDEILYYKNMESSRHLNTPELEENDVEDVEGRAEVGIAAGAQDIDQGHFVHGADDLDDQNAGGQNRGASEEGVGSLG